jgi:hypothetical protein
VRRKTKQLHIYIAPKEYERERGDDGWDDRDRERKRHKLYIYTYIYIILGNKRN